MYQNETNCQATLTIATVEDLQHEQWIKKPVGNRFSRTTSHIQRFHTHSRRCRRFLKVYFCDPLETTQQTILCERSDFYFHQTRMRPEHHPDGKRHSFHCRSKETNEGQTGISIKHATIKRTQTAGMIERNPQKLQTFLKINNSADQYVNIAVMAQNSTYHASMKCAPTAIFHGGTP